jgi:tripartite-type tricarboxylate transporter receptor subunit TctC
LPDVATVAEQGYPGYQFGEWFGLFAPKGLPANIQKRMYEAVAKTVATEDFKKRVADLGLEATATTPDQLKAHLVAEINRIRDIATQTNMLQEKK